MRGALLVSMAFLPGLCEKEVDPSKGIPPAVWHLRQVMEAEITKDERGEYVTPEQAERFVDASEDVARFENIRNPDVTAEVVYLLPRSWQWPQRERLRDLIILLGSSPGTQVLQAEDNQAAGTGFRKAVYGYLFNKKSGLHTSVAELSPEERVKAVLAAATAGDFNNAKFGWQQDQNLAWEYGATALAHDPGESIPKLAALSAKEGPLRAWALTTLARMDDAAAAEALRAFYGSADEPAETGARAAALRFYSTLRRWPAGTELAVLVPGASMPLDPASCKAVALNQAAWDARAADAVRVKLGVEQNALGRKAFVDDGDRASVVVVEVVNRKPGDAGGATTESWRHFRLRRRGGTWVVAR